MVWVNRNINRRMSGRNAKPPHTTQHQAGRHTNRRIPPNTKPVGMPNRRIPPNLRSDCKNPKNPTYVGIAQNPKTNDNCWMNYRRIFVPGGTFFFTVVTYNRTPTLIQPESINLFHDAVNKVCKNHPFRITAWVILPDHLHMIWKLPEKDTDYPTRWRLIKSYFSHHWMEKYPHEVSPSRQKKRECPVWQRRYWEHWIRDNNDLERHVEYIHYNPVKHGIVQAPIDWQFSSFDEYVKRGLYAHDWGSDSRRLGGMGKP